MTNRESKIFQDALNTFGIDNQKEMLKEECAELIVALSHYDRNRASKEAVITELADVSIMLDQMILLFGEKDFEVERERKVRRLFSRILNKDYSDENQGSNT